MSEVDGVLEIGKIDGFKELTIPALNPMEVEVAMFVLNANFV